MSAGPAGGASSAAREPAAVVVRPATPQELPTVAAVLAEAFARDPLIRWLLPDPPRTEAMFATMSRWWYPWPDAHDVAVDHSGRIVGASRWVSPGRRISSGERAASGRALLRAMGPAGALRGILLTRAQARHRPAGTMLYLGEIGAIRHGVGIGTALLRHRADQLVGGAYLECSNAANLPLYRRFGFELTAQYRLPFRGPVMWTMTRPADPA